MNFQIKIIVGLLMMVFLFNPMADRLYVMIDDLFRNMQQLLELMGPG